MSIELKQIEDQTIVITGASSGIGRATALMAAEKGARIVAVARNEHALETLVAEIRDRGGEAVFVAGDVADPGDMDLAAATALEEFGAVDSWVNDAGVGLYGRLDELPLEDKRRLFDVTFWGVVHGCRSALPLLRERGGAIINIGSIESDVALPLTGIYAAAKHAVKAYTDTLRMELEHDDVPVSVTLIKPSSVDTPFFEHARSYLGVEPTAVPPVYAPEVVADAILHAAEEPIRELTVGGGGKFLSAMRKRSVAVADRALEGTMFRAQQTERPPHADILYDAPDDAGAVRGDYDGHVMRSSAYTKAKLHPVIGTAMLAGVGLAIAAGVRRLADRAD